MNDNEDWDFIFNSGEPYKFPPDLKVNPLPPGSKVWTKGEMDKVIASVPEMAKVIHELKLKAIENMVSLVVGSIEGRIPECHEAAAFGRCYIYEDGMEIWAWKGKPIVCVERDNFSFKISKMEEAG